MGRLDGRTVVVVGGGSHLGRAISVSASREGAAVVVAGPHPENVSETVAEIGSLGGAAATGATVDITDEASIARLAGSLDAVDHVVSTAAQHAKGPLSRVAADAVAKAFAAKAVGPLMLAKHLAPRMRDGGSFTFLAGVAGRRFYRGYAVMAATNAATIGVAQALAVELAPLRANAISPGITDSGVDHGTDERGRAALFAGAAKRYPAGRVGQPEDVVEAVLFAMTHPFVTGTVIDVDGGGRLV